MLCDDEKDKRSELSSLQNNGNGSNSDGPQEEQRNVHCVNENVFEGELDDIPHKGFNLK